MTKAFIITEGESDHKILKALLPAPISENVEFVAGTWRSSAISIARSILVAKYIPVALVLDTDTTDPSAIREDRDYLRMSLAEASSGTRFGVFQAVPEIEIIFFEDWDFVGQQIGKPKQAFTHFELEYARLQPKKFLFSQLEDIPYPQALTKLLALMDTKTIERIRQNPLVRDLNNFLLSVIEKSPGRSGPVGQSAVALHTVVA
ncbi:MAG: hypothetical protein HY328_02085 [Chloroflexi bacterium]|nr:hypothetical protein [Chloroflexota bacterium]